MCEVGIVLVLGIVLVVMLMLVVMLVLMLSVLLSLCLGKGKLCLLEVVDVIGVI